MFEFFKGISLFFLSPTFRHSVSLLLGNEFISCHGLVFYAWFWITEKKMKKKDKTYPKRNRKRKCCVVLCQQEQFSKLLSLLKFTELMVIWISFVFFFNSRFSFLCCLFYLLIPFSCFAMSRYMCWLYILTFKSAVSFRLPSNWKI